MTCLSERTSCSVTPASPRLTHMPEPSTMSVGEQLQSDCLEHEPVSGHLTLLSLIRLSWLVYIFWKLRTLN